MKLSISNIAWPADIDQQVYALMKQYRYEGLEIAPTRIFPNEPYDDLRKAEEWSVNLFEECGFLVSSLQSIWFGRQEKLFGTDEERSFLMNYTKKAVDFAQIVKCHNLVFGCPRNRYCPEEDFWNIGVEFFRKIGNYAHAKGTVIGMEANPTIYNTNYINSTMSALRLIKEVNSPGFLLNLDMGTMIYNEESINLLKGNTKLINHVHISEPGLKPILQREIYKELSEILMAEKYEGFVSIEMGKIEDVFIIESVMRYVKEVFGQ